MESVVLSTLAFRINLPTTFTFLSVFEQILGHAQQSLRLPPALRCEACFLAVRTPSGQPLAPDCTGCYSIMLERCLTGASKGVDGRALRVQAAAAHVLSNSSPCLGPPWRVWPPCHVGTGAASDQLLPGTQVLSLLEYSGGGCLSLHGLGVL